MKDRSNLQSIMQYAPDIESPWDGKYKIPWDDPEFSARMLKEHLTQDHDLASRRASYIEEQSNWIHEMVCKSESRKILDLGCGPGFYQKHLANLGHTGKGIDFSPASIEYAKKEVQRGFEFKQEDIRSADYGDDYDLIMILYGEFNVFSPEEIKSILGNAFNSLKDGGTILVEPHTFDAVKRIGQAQDTWFKMPSGLFYDKPHLLLIDNHWDEKQNVALQYFHTLDISSGSVKHYRSTTKAWSENEYSDLLTDAGFINIIKEDDWPININDLFLFSARK